MSKPNLLLIKAGGTIGMTENENGARDTSEARNILEMIPEVHDLAKIDVVEIGNIDSTDMDTSHRVAMAKEIMNSCSFSHVNFDGIVITQGTDSLVSSAAALNYMVQDLGKPIILTGSQQPIFEGPTSDGKRNLYNAVKAATMDIGEVAIVFGNNLVRGNRTIKSNTFGYNSFISPRATLLGSIDEDIILTDQVIQSGANSKITKFFTEFETGIEFYQQVSGSSSKVLESMVNDDGVKGIVLGGFGPGNVQSRHLKTIAKLTEKGKPVAVISNCYLGRANMEAYAVGSAAMEVGAFSAGDMTREAAEQKMMYALGLAKDENFRNKPSIEYVKEIMQEPIGKDISL
jgi:L-asparaginase